LNLGSQQAKEGLLNNLEGVTFYSTSQNAKGWVLNPAGIAVAKDGGLKRLEASSSPDGGYSKW